MILEEQPKGCDVGGRTYFHINRIMCDLRQKSMQHSRQSEHGRFAGSVTGIQ